MTLIKKDLTEVWGFGKMGESKNMTKAEKIKYLLTPAIGFGLGGALWGWGWFGFWAWEKAELSDFMVISGAVFIGLFSTLSLVVFLKNIKIIKKIFIILGGVAVWMIGLYMWNVSFLIFVLIFPPGIVLFPLLFGAILALFYILVLRARVWPVIWRGGIGFFLAFTVGLMLVNIMGSIFSFALTGIILGLSLGWGLYKGQKPK